MFRYYIKNPGKTFATAVRLWGEEKAPEGAEEKTTDDYFEPEYMAAQHRSTAVHNLYHRPGVCGFCGGPTPCIRDE